MILRRSKCRSNLAIKKKATTESSPRTAAHFKSIASAISPRRLLQFAREWSSLILSRTARLRCQDTAKSVNHVAIVAVDYVPIGGLHFQTIARRPRATAQHAPITIGCAAAAFVSIEAPFPNVSAEIVKAYRIRFETAGRHCRATASSRCCAIISCTIGQRPLFSPREFVFNLSVAYFRRCAAFVHQTHSHAPLEIGR